MPMNMTDIARLAGVRRPVVSMWRARHTSGPHPFPAPLPQAGAHGGVLFDEREVTAWLGATGLGNNPDSHAEQPLHTDTLTTLAAHADAASALLLLHHAAQAPLTTLTPEEIDEALLLSQFPAELLPPDLDLTDPPLADLVPRIDDVAEAAFTAEDALARLVESLPSDPAEGSGAALTSPARALLASVLTEIHAETDLPLVPTNLASLTLLTHTLPHAETAAPRSVVALPRLLRTPHARAAWRLLAARGHHITVLSTVDFIDDDAPLVLPASCLAIAVLSPAAGPSTAADELDDVLLALGPTDRAMVLGPASLLVASTGQAARRRLLADAAASGTTLRYAAPLPKGMLTRSARRRLALWVLAGRDSVATAAMTVIADHGDASLSEGVTQAIAADLAVVMSGDTASIRDHAFRSGGPLDAGAVHAAADITAPRTAASEQRLGADLLAEALHADEELLAAVSATGSRDARPEERVGWATLTGRYGSDRPGVRLPSDELDASGPGTVAAIGADELRGARPWGARRIDRLRLEEVAPRARFTEAGDVVYVSAGGPAAMVDDVGGHLVLAPARVFRAERPQPAVEDPWCATPGLVAADIAAQRVPDRDAWRIRLAPRDRLEDVERLRREAAGRRTALQDRLDRLDRAEVALLQGLASGTVRLDPNGGPQ